MISSNATALVNSISSWPDFWLENLKALQKSYTELTALTASLTERINVLKGVDIDYVNACQAAADAQTALNQAFNKQICLMQIINAIGTTVSTTARPSLNHPDPKKFSEDKTKLESFQTQLRIKLQRNADHYICSGQNTKQNQLSYAISCLEDDVFLQMEPFVSETNIDIVNIAALETL